MPKTAEKIEETQEVAEERASAAPITASRFGLEPEYNTIWRINVPMEVTPEQTLEQGFWCHIAMHIRPGDTIRVLPDNMQWEQVLHVAAKGNQWAHVVQKELYDLRVGKMDRTVVPSRYKIEFAGSHHKWRVLRDGKMLKDGFETDSLANRWAANHEQASHR